MINFIKNLWTKNPLLLILVSGFLLRLISVIFAKGFGMHDDHFLVIEASQSWVDGHDYNNWLPGGKINAQPTGHSLFYVGLHYLLFLVLNFLKLTDPQSKMYIVRFIHASLSMLVIYYGFKITEKISDKTIAKNTALLLAVFWFMPWLSVRNLVEVVCMPFLMIGVWMIYNISDSKHKHLYIFLAGVIFGISLNIRFQTSIFIIGIIVSLLFDKKPKNILMFIIGLFVSFSLFQGTIDYFIWHKPFAEFFEYVKYNFNNSDAYVSNTWYSYILVLIGILIPPVSIFLMLGFFISWRKHLTIFLPAFLFLLFHSFFPNKQERFILPIVPFIIILGMSGWDSIVKKNLILQNKVKVINWCWIFFWCLNIILLTFISTMYSKKARVESMTYLSKYNNIKTILIEDSNHGSAKMPPEFYLGQWISVYEINNTKTVDSLRVLLNKTSKYYYPGFVLFFEDKNIVNRIKNVELLFPKLKFEKIILPGMVDKILYLLNPVNSNQTIYIFRTF